MPAVISSLSKNQENNLLSLFSLVRLHLLYKASIHGFTAAAFHSRCDKQGPTITVAYNAAGFVFGAYTSKDYTQSGEAVNDGEAFLYSIGAERKKTLRVGGISGQHAFTDGGHGPHFGALVFLHNDQPAVYSNPGTCFNFQAAEMHGDDLALTEFEVYRVEGTSCPGKECLKSFDPVLPEADMQLGNSVVLCVLATDDEEDVALQIHFTLLQSFCCDSSINILRVSGVQRLRQLLDGVDANQNQEEIGDLHCMLVTVGLL
ncbi:hypothetical protein GOODEAATRI_002811 [Goodea atripinnis]|uniref:TLDc domain-containing protein n=1 Tax=Goodea atripinnis TaxID=208336 RepID=A0ABV0MNU4_9TELE